MDWPLAECALCWRRLLLQAVGRQSKMGRPKWPHVHLQMVRTHWVTLANLPSWVKVDLCLIQHWLTSKLIHGGSRPSWSMVDVVTYPGQENKCLLIPRWPEEGKFLLWNILEAVVWQWIINIHIGGLCPPTIIWNVPHWSLFPQKYDQTMQIRPALPHSLWLGPWMEEVVPCLFYHKDRQQDAEDLVSAQAEVYLQGDVRRSLRHLLSQWLKWGNVALLTLSIWASFFIHLFTGTLPFLQDAQSAVLTALLLSMDVNLGFSLHSWNPAFEWLYHSERISCVVVMMTS